MQHLEHKGYYGRIDIDTEDGTLSGTVEGINDVIHYEAKTVRALVREFKRSINEYLAYCKETGRKPDQTYSGKFLVRLEEGLHRRAASKAKAEGRSLNDLAVRAIEREVEG